MSLTDVLVWTVCCPPGGRLSRGDGEGLSPADVSSEPPLSVEEAGPPEEEASGLVSESLCLLIPLSNGRRLHGVFFIRRFMFVFEWDFHSLKAIRVHLVRAGALFLLSPAWCGNLILKVTTRPNKSF